MPKLPRRWRNGALLGVATAAVTLLILFGQLFTQPALWLTNLLYASTPISNKIVIVALDDASLSAYGRSVANWSRSLHADLVNVLSKDGARVVAFDVLFAEPTDADATFAAAMSAAQDNGTSVVLAAAGAQQASETSNGAQTSQPLSYQSILFPVAALHDAASMIGHVNVNADPDDYIRRIPLAITAPNQRILSLSTATYLAYLRIPAEAVNQVVKFGANTVQVTPQRIIPVDASDQMMTDFFGPAGTFPVYSYKAVHDGTVNPSVFSDKIVLVGALNAAGATDRYLVPTSRGQLMSGIEIHANAIETLLQNRPLVPQSTTSRVLTILVIAMVSSMIGIYLRWYWALIGYALALIVGFILASVLFSVAQQVIALLYPTLALTIVLTVVLITNIRLETQSRTRTQLLLNSVSKLDEQRLILADTLRQIAADTTLLLQCGNVLIWLWQEETGQLEQVFVGQPITDDIAALVQTALTAKRLIVESQWAVIPLIFQNMPLGAIAAAQRQPDRRFSDEQLRLFQQYAERIAPALTNSRLYTARLQQNELLEAILASSPDPMLVLDSASLLLRANLAAKALFMIEGEDYQKPVRALFDEIDLDAAPLDEIEQGLSAHIDFQRELSIGTRSFNLRGAPLHVAQAGWVLVLNDITSLKELDTLKTQMIRMASHDLNNPLSVMSGYLEILMNGDMPEEHPRILVTLQQATSQMSAIIHGILDLERARAGYLNMEETAVNTLVQSVVADYESQVQDKRLSLILNVPETPIMLRADRQQLREAINNLVGNALKYTPASGSITVQITQTDKKVRLIITDTGYGIPKALQSNLFQPFYRAKTKATAQIPGTGLGLSLVKAVVDAHSGKVWVESEENVGSTFVIELPVT